MRRLQGLVIATLTPMHEDGSLDQSGFAAHVQDLLENGAEGLFVAGTTGEGLLLDEEERLEVVRAAVRLVAGRVPVVGLCGGLTTAGAVRLAARMRDAGADGVAALTPFFYHVDVEAMAEHFRRVADAAQCPTYLYSIPGLTGVSLPVAVLERLRVHPYFGGLKFSYCDLEQLGKYVRTGAPVFIGCDSLITQALRLGAAGTVSGTAACLPAPFATLFARIRQGGDPSAAQALATRLDAIMAALPPIAGYKAALARRGVIASAAVRRPLRPLGSEEMAHLDAALKGEGL
ncbi:MAG TPA: dihydrodipicolinate synthase family protein [Candidatus Methylomirabilis sp.]|nr:dihydrodipicolinate synthase family protein [Candidatus Methylomirabilis sp.]